MKTFRFFKYHGTGNDFIMLDNRETRFPKEQAIIEKLCHRRFGIGADGFILLENHDTYDFRMVYYNSDGRESSMCGNGGRCIVAFAALLGLAEPGKTTTFEAIDGYHEAILVESVENGFRVDLKMQDVAAIHQSENAVVLDTGSPHYVVRCDDPEQLDIIKEAHHIRYNEPYTKEGINVNFITPKQSGIQVRTYERGVENETYSCGTGVVAAAIASSFLLDNPSIETIYTKGGNLSVQFEYSTEKGYYNIHLIGPAVKVFEGEFTL